MNLFILTQADGNPVADKTAAAVVSVTDDTQVGDLGNLVLGDSEPLVVKFTTGTAAPAFAGDGTYTLSVSLGAVTSGGTQNSASASGLTVITGGWSGRLALTGTDLIAAVNTAGGGACASRGGEFTLQVRVSDPSGYTVTYALLPVFIEWRVPA